jgi:hypothetical protein
MKCDTIFVSVKTIETYGRMAVHSGENCVSQRKFTRVGENIQMQWGRILLMIVLGCH